jgi:hypothetical protein
VLCSVGGRGALGLGRLTVDLGLVSLLGGTPALLGLVEALEALAFPGLGAAFTFVGASLAFVGLALALIGDAISLVGDPLAAVRHPLARVGTQLTLGQLALAPLAFVLAGIFVVGRASVRRPEHAVECSSRFPPAPFGESGPERRLRGSERSPDHSRFPRVREILGGMSHDQYDQVRRDAERARLDAQVALDAARRRAAMIAGRLDELRSRGADPHPHDDGGDRGPREALTAVEFARDRDRRGHERAARAHERAARRHDAAAAVYDRQDDAAGATRERTAGVRERHAAEHDRLAATQT